MINYDNRILKLSTQIKYQLKCQWEWFDGS